MLNQSHSSEYPHSISDHCCQTKVDYRVAKPIVNSHGLVLLNFNEKASKWEALTGPVQTSSLPADQFKNIKK